MVPLKIRLKGFMCYRDECEISFSGSTLWALYGENGAGKSTLLDAMRFALYGVHRMGSQGAQHLIHHQADSLKVEFEFAVGENAYRVQRTLKKGRQTHPTALVTHLSGPDRAQPQVIIGVKSKTELTDWVSRTIGLSEKSFTYAMMLQQGKSDALLSAESSERHALLTQIIDLAPYKRLCELAEGHRKKHNDLAKKNEDDLNKQEPVTEAELADLAVQREQAQQRKKVARQQQNTLFERRAHAQSWLKLQHEYLQLKQTLTLYDSLLSQAKQIEMDAKRSKELTEVLPSLQVLYDKQQICSRLHNSIVELEEKEKQQKKTCDELKDANLQARENIGQLRQQQDELYQRQGTLQRQLHELQPAMHQLATIKQIQGQLKELTTQLDTFEPDLALQEQHLQQAYEQTLSAVDLLPKLQRLHTARTQWHTHQSQSQDIAQNSQNVEALCIASNKAIELLTCQFEGQQRQVEQAQQEATRTQTLFHVQQKRERNFQKLDGEVMCPHCGQPLTPEHRGSERQRIKEALRGANEDSRQAKNHLLQQENLLTEIEQQKDRERKQHSESNAHLKTLWESLQKLELSRKRTEGQIESILHGLPLFIIEQIQGHNGHIDLHACLQATYPAAPDLKALEQRAQSKPSIEKQWQELKHKLQLFEEISSQYRYVYSQLEQIEQHCPPDQQEHIQQLETTLRQELLTVTERAKDIRAKHYEQEQGQKNIEGKIHESEQKLIAITRQLASTQQAYWHEKAAIEERQRMLPAHWQAQVADLSGATISLWQQELQGLQGAEARLQEVITARHRYQGEYERLLANETESATIPIEARCSVEQLQAEIAQAEEQYQQAEQEERAVSTRHATLSEVFIQRQKALSQLQESRRLAALYAELRKLLGSDYLQRYLLQRAEKGIVFCANDFLNRMSGGTLRLELVELADQGTKALDLVAYNSLIDAGKPQPVGLFSGSQRFRVSVSLALGIGKYAAHDNHRIEAVIIDEGFGSLDQNGIRDMIAVIREDLQNILKRVIVVSHQPEIFDGFDNKYQIALVDGSTEVSLA